MKTIRFNTFETNSSSCHALTHISNTDWLKFCEHPDDYALHIPDCETYCDEPEEVEYQLLTVKEAWELYNKLIDDYNENYKQWAEKENREYPQFHTSMIPDKVYEKIPTEEAFYRLLNWQKCKMNKSLECDETFGHFFNFDDVKENITGLDFEYEWMNNFYGKTRYDVEKENENS